MGNIIRKKDNDGNLLYYAGMGKVNGRPKPLFALQPFMAKSVSDSLLMRLTAYFVRKQEKLVIMGGTNGTGKGV